MAVCYTIWSNCDLDYEDWRDDLEAEYPSLSDADRIAIMYEINNDYLDDERQNLNIQLNRSILVIADIGRWNGRYSGYAEINSGKICDCLHSNTDYATWFVDELGDLRCNAVHHDGTNHYLYRVYKDRVSEDQINQLKDKIYEGKATRKDITRITQKIGDKVSKVYGWC